MRVATLTLALVTAGCAAPATKYTAPPATELSETQLDERLDARLLHLYRWALRGAHSRAGGEVRRAAAEVLAYSPHEPTARLLLQWADSEPAWQGSPWPDAGLPLPRSATPEQRVRRRIVENRTILAGLDHRLEMMRWAHGMRAVALALIDRRQEQLQRRRSDDNAESVDARVDAYRRLKRDPLQPPPAGGMQQARAAAVEAHLKEHGDPDSVEPTLERLQAENALLEAEIAGAASRLKLYIPDGRHRPTIEGKVIHTDSEACEVTLDVGSDDRVHVGYEFTIYRGNTFVSRVKVTSVRPDHCTAREISEYHKYTPRKGDQASTRVE